MKTIIPLIEQIGLKIWIIAQSLLLILDSTSVLILPSFILFIPSYLLIFLFLVTNFLDVSNR